ncbi:hypothetical protein B0T11DRAFT_141677 [Plectosphaerella cucumerina]|uniref:Uncharacterized protein n=1 Tax=Plectosphaerella cucumerina TaxID=40658 RepID=A0A8K0WXT6_9PEZI|nr:hypothetical protein B0T11DRAFT_141677 [Plectosphaerella cucumerina]
MRPQPWTTHTPALLGPLPSSTTDAMHAGLIQDPASHPRSQPTARGLSRMAGRETGGEGGDVVCPPPAQPLPALFGNPLQGCPADDVVVSAGSSSTLDSGVSGAASSPPCPITSSDAYISRRLGNIDHLSSPSSASASLRHSPDSSRYQHLRSQPTNTRRSQQPPKPPKPSRCVPPPPPPSSSPLPASSLLRMTTSS